MNAAFINPFIAALHNVLSMMAQIELTPGKPQKKTNTIAKGDVSGLIDMVGGEICGSLSITFESELAKHIIHNMLGETHDAIDDDVSDMVGEITNMICGGAKKDLSKLGYNFNMATPIVFSGKNHTLSHSSSGHKMIMPFDSPYGKAFLEMCFDT
ncbi:MAG: chemotaxis protein CheX [Paraglaciecola sp.]|jgi:chemotaxis protein CheX